MHAAYKLPLALALVAVPALALSQPPAAPAPRTAEERAKADKKAVVVPFELLKSRHMAVQVKINGKGPYRLIFDTGAPVNLLNTKVGKEAEVKGGLIDTLEIGDLKVEKVGTMVADHPTVTAISKALGPVEGLVGFPVFAKFKTTVDYQKKEMTFTPTDYEPGDTLKVMMSKLLNPPKEKPEPRTAAPAGVWGFAVDKAAGDEDAGVTVKEVFAGSAAADAGLKAGDRLLTLDGRWTDSVVDTFTAAGLVKPGRSAVVVVKRDGKEVKLTVKPAAGL